MFLFQVFDNYMEIVCAHAKSRNTSIEYVSHELLDKIETSGGMDERSIKWTKNLHIVSLLLSMIALGIYFLSQLCEFSN